MSDHGLGALPSPFDPRDFPLDALYALTGTEKAIVIPPTYIAPSATWAPLNQGTTPQCVAFSSGGMKICEDGAWPLDEGQFFTRIGGGPNGAVVRDAFDQLLKVGYPPDEANHKISAYFAVPMVQAEIQAAIMAFGPVVLGMTWYNSWFMPVAGVLPKPDTRAGGHAILAIGWDSRGLRLRNSWGNRWGIAGDCYLPWSMVAGEAWKAVDVPTPIPTPPTRPEATMIPLTVTGPGGGTATLLAGTGRRLIDIATGALVVPTANLFVLGHAIDLKGVSYGNAPRHAAHIVAQGAVLLVMLDSDATIAPPAPAKHTLTNLIDGKPIGAPIPFGG